ncbi:MAG: tRNA lysidine(34) synthetase TilS [Nitrospirae bacterium]|nr:tRNA lysidine(34) synthetase TilS [Nitrospirota bacterium]
MDNYEFQFIKKVFNFAKKYKMFAKGQKILVGLSGGADSVCLLNVLLTFDLNISALYVDHGLRPTQTPSEIEFCSNLCSKLKVDFMVESVDVYQYQKLHNIGIGASARTKRYEALEAVAHKIGTDKIALGHNKDDQCETFLINMLRGSGMSGLCGIPPTRNRIIRPILCVNRSEIRSFLETRRINYITDPSNLTNKYLRNNIRSELLPLLKKYNPSIMQTIYNTTEILSVEDKFLESVTSQLMTEIVINWKDGIIELDIKKLTIIDLALLRRIIRQAISHFNLSLGLIHIDNIINLIKDLNTGGCLNLPDDLIVIKGYDRLIIKNVNFVNSPIIGCELNIPGVTIIDKTGSSITASFTDLPQTQYGKDETYLDFDKIIGKTLKIRTRNKGDFFYPQGFGKKKKLQDFFIDEKIPREIRDTIPIIYLNNEIVWIAGHRADERFHANMKTINILKLVMRTLPILSTGSRKGS